MRIGPANFTGDPVSFTCFLPLTSGGEDSASTVVDPQGCTHCTDTSIINEDSVESCSCIVQLPEHGLFTCTCLQTSTVNHSFCTHPRGHLLIAVSAFMYCRVASCIYTTSAEYLQQRLSYPYHIPYVVILPQNLSRQLYIA